MAIPCLKCHVASSRLSAVITEMTERLPGKKEADRCGLAPTTPALLPAGGSQTLDGNFKDASRPSVFESVSQRPTETSSPVSKPIANEVGGLQTRLWLSRALSKTNVSQTGQARHLLPASVLDAFKAAACACRSSVSCFIDKTLEDRFHLKVIPSAPVNKIQTVLFYITPCTRC